MTVQENIHSLMAMCFDSGDKIKPNRERVGSVHTKTLKLFIKITLIVPVLLF